MLSGWSDGTILARCSCFATHGAVGDQGYGSMDRRYVDAYMYDAWLMRNARYGLARHTWDKYHAASTPVQRRAILLQDNPRWRGTIRYAGMNYQIFIYETLSINDERPAEIIELSNRDGIRVGWCETFYGSGTSAIIKELFVWPPFRRRGYGTILEAAAVIRTQGWVDELVLWFYEPDAIPRSRANGRLFALGRGYEWTWRKSSRPAPAGTAAKRIDITKAERTLRPRETDSMLIPIRRTHMVESLRHEVDSQRGYSMLCFVKVSSCELRETIRCLGRSMSCKVKSGCLVRDLTVESGLAACRDIGAVEVCRE